MEQDKNSPHRYMDSDVKDYAKGGVVVELGAAEASFSLELVGIASEIYIFECCDIWQKPLKATFENYSNVHIIQKFVSNKDTGNYCTIDKELQDIQQKITVIKMDIEGYEPLALQGASNILKKAKKLLLLVCAYHTKTAQKEIEDILQKDFSITPRPGYMLFWFYEKIFSYPYFRRGILKCCKK